MTTGWKNISFGTAFLVVFAILAAIFILAVIAANLGFTSGHESHYNKVPSTQTTP